MKITNDQSIYGILPQTRTTQTRTESQEAFADLLAQAMGQTKASQAVASTASPSQTDATLAPGQSAIYERVGGLLGTLEQFAQVLGDPNSTPKDLEPLLRDMENQAYELEDELSALQGSDELSTIAGELLGHVQAESIKYWRGDYV